MLLLLGLNTLPLSGVVGLPGALGSRGGWLKRLQPWLTRLSGAWLILAALAASGHIAHQSIRVPVGSRSYSLMFW